MQIHQNIEEVNNIKNLCVSMGTFDGVHLGHRKIINSLLENTKKFNGESMIITFDPHPRITLGYDSDDLNFINNINEKLVLFEKLGVDHVLVIEFTKEFSQLSSDEFVKKYLKDALNIKHLTVGYDHTFGSKEKSKNLDLKSILTKYNIDCERVSAVGNNDFIVSSTKIRQAIQKGDIKSANLLLDYNYEFTAKVVGGRQIGREIGFPTANLEIIGYKKLIPEDGVYEVNVLYDNNYFKGVLNIGLNPTVDNKFRTVEVHILNFSEDIYNETLKVEFIDRIRGEMKFDSIDELKTQIQKDIDSIFN